MGGSERLRREPISRNESVAETKPTLVGEALSSLTDHTEQVLVESSASWIKTFHPRREPRLRLLCFPFAGGGASVFRTWGEALPPHVEVWSVQLPGREERFREKPFTRCSELVRAIADAVGPKLIAPFCFFGHSMGALVAFQLARELRRRGARGPEHLFLSGRLAPHLPPRPPLHRLPDAELVAAIRRLNGTPNAVFDEPELLSLFLPILRADFSVTEAEPHVAEPALDCPITAFGGREDDRASEAELEAWREHTTGAFSRTMFPGDHFYLVSARPMLLDRLALLLASH
jgi:medium-chain acyl-[acyl-carrier-protein] hydrolase